MPPVLLAYALEKLVYTIRHLTKPFGTEIYRWSMICCFPLCRKASEERKNLYYWISVPSTLEQLAQGTRLDRASLRIEAAYLIRNIAAVSMQSTTPAEYHKSSFNSGI